MFFIEITELRLFVYVWDVINIINNILVQIYRH